MNLWYSSLEVIDKFLMADFEEDNEVNSDITDTTDDLGLLVKKNNGGRDIKKDRGVYGNFDSIKSLTDYNTKNEENITETNENKNKKINEFIAQENGEKNNGNKDGKLVEIIVSTWNDKFEEESKKSYSITIKNCLKNIESIGNNINFKELMLNRKRKRDKNEVEKEA